MKPFIDQFLDQISKLLGSYVPSLVGAMILLVLGLIVSFLFAFLFKRMLNKTKISQKLSDWIGSDIKPIAVEKVGGRIFFWIALLFVMVSFFQILGLTVITQPLNSLLLLIFEYAPRLLAAGFIALAAWLFAKILKILTLKGLDKIKTGNKFAELSGKKIDDKALNQSIANSIYWLVLLLFLPAILSTLELGGLMEPVQKMIRKILLFMPNIFISVLIIFIGWFFAKILRKIITNLLAAIGTDRLSEKIGLTAALGKQKLSEVGGLFLYIVILVPIIISALNALKLDSITTPSSNMLNMILTAVPSIFAALLLLFIAYIVARWITGLVANLLTGIGFDNILIKIGLTEKPIEAKWSPSEIVGKLVLIAIMLFAFVEALMLIDFASLSILLSKFLILSGHVLFGLIIFSIGLYLANLASRVILSTGKPHTGLLAFISKIAILVLSSSMALSQMGLANEIIMLAFGIVLGAVAIAFAISFGIGGKEVAGQKIKKWVDSMNGRKQ